ncbi:hypothetical protein SKAU_G00032770 [Synaphobranchus kaupii]|uniref:Uncharacterized protein n=1 Tax=Synaphobranchus kaupii TaxID=118154 RepID=A0A9Q1JGD6_SYNKA|nr:hypothetical protein SKAU_G00032770 [Synaphobranchus kaupii]
MQRQRTAQNPVVPPRPSAEDLNNPIPHSLNKQLEPDNIQNNNDTSQQPTNKTLGRKGIIQNLNPFSRSSTQSSTETSEDPVERRVSDTKQNPGVFKGVMQKVNPFRSASQAHSPLTQAHSPLTQVEQEGNDHEEKPSGSKQNPGVFKGMMQKVNPFRSASQVVNSDLSASSDSLTDDNKTQVEQEGNDHEEKPSGSKQNPGVFKGVMQKVNPFRSASQVVNSDLSASSDSLTDDNKTQVEQEGNDHEEKPSGTKQNPGVFKGMMQKVNPFRSASQVVNSDLSASSDSLTDDNKTQNPGVFKGVMQKVNPFRSASQVVNSDLSASSDSLTHNNNTQVAMGKEVEGHQTKSDQPIREKKGMVTFRIKRFLPGALFRSAGKDSEQEAGEEREESSQQESTVEVQDVEMAPFHSVGDIVESEEEDTLMDWWRTVEGWSQWNESAEFEEDEELAAEQAADRVFMAAKLFVWLFNQRGASLQQRILELLALADAADSFHKRTVTASVGGGVASVAGSVTAITGLILAPFTFGTSIIVTAVGISVATAGGLTSASANITDTVHSNTDRKKVEAMIEGYQEEMKDIRECLEFVQEGMDALEQWNFEQYKETVSKQAMNQNVRHVMKEGGRAGKALMINTESLISTVQVFSLAGGAAKAAQVISVTTGVMSGLFLALDLFFLAKDSIELRKGAKTQFATKIREVCKDLQNGLLELNRIKADLQKTMDGIELEEEEDKEEEEEPALASDPVKLTQLEG